MTTSDSSFDHLIRKTVADEVQRTSAAARLAWPSTLYTTSQPTLSPDVATAARVRQIVREEIAAAFREERERESILRDYATLTREWRLRHGA